MKKILAILTLALLCASCNVKFRLDQTVLLQPTWANEVKHFDHLGDILANAPERGYRVISFNLTEHRYYVIADFESSEMAKAYAKAYALDRRGIRRCGVFRNADQSEYWLDPMLEYNHYIKTFYHAETENPIARQERTDPIYYGPDDREIGFTKLLRSHISGLGRMDPIQVRPARGAVQVPDFRNVRHQGFYGSLRR